SMGNGITSTVSLSRQKSRVHRAMRPLVSPLRVRHERRAREASGSETPRVHNVARWCGRRGHAAAEIYADLSKTNPRFKKLYDSLVTYRSDSLVWQQVAELSFDSFMLRMRTRS